MKRILFILIGLFFTLISSAQFLYKVAYYDWSNPTTFMLSPQPLILGYGPKSDSLSIAYEGTTFFEYQDEYYPITSWADYYYWFTKRYWYWFESPLLYEYYYLAENDLGMARYIARNYRGNYYPSMVIIDLGIYNIGANRMQSCRSLPYTEEKAIKMQKRLHAMEKMHSEYPLPEHSLFNNTFTETTNNYNHRNTSSSSKRVPYFSSTIRSSVYQPASISIQATSSVSKTTSYTQNKSQSGSLSANKK